MTATGPGAVIGGIARPGAFVRQRRRLHAQWGCALSRRVCRHGSGTQARVRMTLDTHHVVLVRLSVPGLARAQVRGLARAGEGDAAHLPSPERPPQCATNRLTTFLAPAEGGFSMCGPLGALSKAPPPNFRVPPFFQFGWKTHGVRVVYRTSRRCIKS